jgi:soluble lytic murein transglycosylase-like protein
MGLMQIEPDVHSTALSPVGGRLAAFDPLTNLRVGTRHLQGLIQDSASLEDALRLYALDSGQGRSKQYVDRVLAEQKLMEHISQGQKTALANKNNATPTKLPQAQM